MKHFRQAAEFALLSGIKVTTIDSFQVSKVDMSAENLLIFSSNRNQMIMLIDLWIIYLLFILLLLSHLTCNGKLSSSMTDLNLPDTASISVFLQQTDHPTDCLTYTLT